MAHIPFDHATLDPFTEERLLSGTVHPDDLPPTLGRVAGLLHSARAGALLDPELEQDKERGAATHNKERALTRELEQISAMAMILSGQPAAALTPAGAHRPRVLRRVKIVAAVFAATLVIGSGLAFAGALPGGTQDAAAKMFAKLGITVPRHDQTTKPGRGPDVNGPAKFGLCQAFSSGQGGQNGNKDNAVPFQNLQKAATAAGQTVDQFCAGATPGGKQQGDQGTAGDQGKDGSPGNSGNHGQGNQGNGKGNDNGTHGHGQSGS